MKASKLHSYGILLLSCLDVLYYSLKTLCTVFCKKNHQKSVNKIAQDMSKRLLRHIKLSYKFFGKENLKLETNRRYIVMCNHASLYDIPLSFLAIPGSLRMIAKKELFRIPIWGAAMRKSDFIPIDRNNREEAKKNLELAKEKMDQGIIIWIAPEGTRSKTGKLQTLKKGGFLLAFQTNAIIIPMGIRGSFNILPPKTSDIQLQQHVEVHIGKPIDTNNYKIKERAKLMKDVEEAIRVAAGLKEN